MKLITITTTVDNVVFRVCPTFTLQFPVSKENELVRSTVKQKKDTKRVK